MGGAVVTVDGGLWANNPVPGMYLLKVSAWLGKADKDLQVL